MYGGATGSGAPRGNTNALKHGRYTRVAIEERQQLRAFAAAVAVTDSTDRMICFLTARKGACPMARSLWKVGYKYHGRCWSKGSGTAIGFVVPFSKSGFVV